MTIANSLMYMAMSPSKPICLTRCLTSFALPARNTSLALSPSPNLASHDVIRVIVALPFVEDDRSWSKTELSSDTRTSSLARSSEEAVESFGRRVKASFATKTRDQIALLNVIEPTF